MSRRYRWVVVGIFFMFLLLHQADKLLIGPLLTDIRNTFQLTEAQTGAIGTGALVVGALCYPLWGYFYDRFARSRLLALASFIWGSTTWLGAIAPTFGTFLVARASTGIDDSSYPGLYSLLSDYFSPAVRGKVNGLLHLTAPLGYMLGLVLALLLGPIIGWRNVFLITGGLGIVLAGVIFFGVRDLPRGQSEPELADVAALADTKFSWAAARGLLHCRTLIPLFLQGFFGVFPLNIISFWLFNYLETERRYSQDEIFATMSIAVLVMAGGAVLGGWLGDRLFKRTLRGRLMVCAAGVLSAAVLMLVTLTLPNDSRLLFGFLFSLTALFVLFSGPNVVCTIYDITLPEVRSTALSIQYFVESFGAAFAPLMVGILAERQNLGALQPAILIVSVSTWLLCGLFLIVAAVTVPHDIESLRQQLRDRAEAVQQGRVP